MTSYPEPEAIPLPLTTSRLHLRAYRPGDGVMYYQMLQDNRQHLYEFMPHFYFEMCTLEDARRLSAARL